MAEQSLTNKTISGLIWKFCERFSSQIISFIVSVILARLLLPEDYGIVAIVTVFITLANALITNGLGTALIQKKDSDNDDFSTMFWASLIMSVFLYFILFLTAPLVGKLYDNNYLTMIIRVMGLILPISSIKSIHQSYVSKKMIFKHSFLSTIFGTCISAAVGIWMAYSGYGVWALVAQYMISVVIDTIVLSVIVSWKPKFVFSKEKFKSLYSYGWKVMLTTFIGTLFEQLRSLIIGYKYSSADLAYYNKGEHMACLAVDNVNVAIESVAFPALSKIQDDRTKLKEKMQDMIKLSNFLLMPILLGLASIAKPLTILLFTEKWIFMVPFIQVICVGKVFTVINTINAQAIKAIGKSETLLKLEFVKKPIYILFLVIGAIISPMGVALSYSIYNICAFVINCFPNKKYFNYTFIQQVIDVLPSLISSILMALAVVLIGIFPVGNILIQLLIEVSIGVCIYGILTLVMQRKQLAQVIVLSKKFLSRNSNKN